MAGEDVNAVGYYNNNRGGFHGNDNINIVETTETTTELAKITKWQIKTAKTHTQITEATYKKMEGKTEEE